MEQPPPIVPPIGGTFSSGITGEMTELKEIAQAQRLLLWSILAGIAAFGFKLLLVLTIPFQVWAAYNLSKKLNLRLAWLWTILTIIPLIGLIVLLVINSKATSALRAAGVRVGLLGANLNDLEKA
jgi:hypothetical protein